MRLDAYLTVIAPTYRFPDADPLKLEVLAYRQTILRPRSLVKPADADKSYAAATRALTILRVIDESSGNFLQLAHDQQKKTALIKKLTLVVRGHGDLTQAGKECPGDYLTLEMDQVYLHRVRIWGNPRFHAVAGSVWGSAIAATTLLLGPLEELEFICLGGPTWK